MRVKELEINDYMSHNHTLIDCTKFQSAVVIGRFKNNPREAMGLGKSALFGSMEFAFFNHTPFNMDAIVRHGAEKCKVRVDFEASSTDYRIIRARTKKGKADLRLYQLVGENWEDLTQKTAKETEAELAKILKISHGAFRASILFAQADLHGLASVTPRERKAMLKEPLQILVYNEFEKISKKKSVAANKVVEKTKTLIEALGNPNEDIISFEKSLNSFKNSLNDYLLVKDKYSKELDESKLLLSKLVSEIKPDASVVKQSLEVVKQNKNKLTKIIVNLKQQIELDESKIVSNNKKNEFLISQLDDLKIKKDKINSTLLRSKEDIKKDLSLFVNKEIEGSSYINSLNAEKQKLSKTIPDQDLCDLCKQPVSKDHRENCENNRKENLEICIANIEKYKTVLEKVKSKKTLVETELTQLENHVVSQQNIENLFVQKQSELLQAQNLLNPLNDAISARKSELSNLLISEEDLRLQEINLLSSLEIAESISNQALIDSTNSEILKIKNLIKDVEQAIASTEIQIGITTQKITSRTVDKEKLDQFKIDLKSQEKHYSLCCKAQYVFSPSGIPTWIINTILDDLQLEANKILAKIRPEIELKFSLIKTKADGNQEDTLDIFYHKNGVEHYYEQLSGGEKVLIALTLKRALSHVIQHRIGIDIKMLNLDEVDSQFDENTTDAFIDIIKQWQNEMTIFIISHNPYVKSKFQHAILIEGDRANGSVGSLISN